MSEHSLWLGVLYLHLLSMAFFLGGQMVLVAAVLPVARRDSDRTQMRAIARRFGLGSLLALLFLIATGTAMATHFHYWEDGTLQLKLVLVALIFVLGSLHLRWPRFHALSAAILLATLVIVWLGLDLAH